MPIPSDTQPDPAAADAEALLLDSSLPDVASDVRRDAGSLGGPAAAEANMAVGLGADEKTTLRPSSTDALIAAIVEANATGRVLSVGGFGSKRSWGHTDATATALCTQDLCGIYDYSPDELVLTCGAGTPLCEVTAALHANGQHLPFAPPAWPLRLTAGVPDQTLGGVVATNLAGSARFRRGAARDYLLGFSAVSGRGEAFKAGGKVMKNVTGYDLSKLMCGSFGTLAVLTELSFKVLPQPMARLFAVTTTDRLEVASQLLAQLRGHPAEIANAWFIPPATFAAWAGAEALGLTSPGVIFELAGPAGGLNARLASIRTALTERGWSQPVEALHGRAAAHPSAAMDSAANETSAGTTLGTNLADLAPLLDQFATRSEDNSDPDGNASALIRVSATPTEMPRIAAALEALPEAHAPRTLLDCAGHWLWVLGQASALSHIAANLRIATGDAGHVTVVHQPVGAEIPAFSQPPAPILAIQRQIQRAFDPNGVLAPNRMFPA